MTLPNLEQALIDRIQSGVDAYRNAEMFDFRNDRFWQKGWLAAMEADPVLISLTSPTATGPATSASQTRKPT